MPPLALCGQIALSVLQLQSQRGSAPATLAPRQLHSRYSFTHQGERERQTLFLLFLVMNKTTQTKFTGLGGCSLRLHSNMWSTDESSSITVCDTGTGDTIDLDGLSPQVLRGAIKNYVSSMESREETAERRLFVDALAEKLVDIHKAWRRDKAEAEAKAKAEAKAEAA